ncbi:hypothetical protein KCU71_g12082, partial [Aureobasidium melanogenum]
MLYTTASEALVQPKLTFVSSDIALQGLVKSMFASTDYTAQQCFTPVTESVDGIADATCLEIRFSYQGDLDLENYPSQWESISRNGGVASSWIEVVDTTNAFEIHRRIVNNVTLAVPHIGVIAAARDPRNRILQVDDLDGQASYFLEAQVHSPVVNVLCVNMNKDELTPIVYTEWSNNTLNAALWSTGSQLAWYQPGNQPNGTYLNKTVVDDLFGWGEKYKTSPPVFPKLPIAYNTVMNHTGAYGRRAVYLLGRSPMQDEQDIFTLCSLKSYKTTLCSTQYNSSASGDSIESLCQDNQQSPSLPDKTEVQVISPDWPELATFWADSLNLNAGIVDGDASMARLLTQLALIDPDLTENQPSLAEALAVLASGMTLMATQDTQFNDAWNYSSTIMDPGQYQSMNATLLAKEYTSGDGRLPATNAFYAVLAATFLLDLFCLGYFVLQNGLITDFTEPFNLFALAINSPPSAMMAGSSSTGPSKKQIREKWFIDAEGEDLILGSHQDHDSTGEVDEPELDIPLHERTLLHEIRRSRWLRKTS